MGNEDTKNKVEITVKKADMKAFMSLHFLKNYRAIIIVYSILILWELITYSYATDGNFFVSWNFIMIIFVAILFCLTYILNITAAGKAYATNKVFRHTCIYDFGYEGFTEESQVNKTSLTWEYIYRVYQNSRVILLYISSMQAYIIPKAQLSDNQLKHLVDCMIMGIDIKKRKYNLKYDLVPAKPQKEDAEKL